MWIETEDGIMMRADAQIARLLMDGSRTERRLLAADRTIARARQRVLVLRRQRAASDAREHEQIERELAREMEPSWGRSIRFKVRTASKGRARGFATKRKAQQHILNPGSRTAVRTYQQPLTDGRGRVAIFFRVRYVGFKSKIWREGLSADHALYILRDEALEQDGIEDQRAPISNMGSTSGEVAARWRALELVEREYRANAVVQHRIIWNLPYQLTGKQRREMVADYCARTFGRLGLPYVAAIHKPDLKGNRNNFHAHICFSGRPCERVDEGRFEIALEKVNGLTDAGGIMRLRALATAHANNSCRDAGLSLRFSHLTYEARGIDAVRQKHVGPAAMKAHECGEKVAVIKHNERVVVRNEMAAARDAARHELSLTARLTDLAKGLFDNAAARTRLASFQKNSADIAERALSLASAPRPRMAMSLVSVLNVAQRADAMAQRIAARERQLPIRLSKEHCDNLAIAASKLAEENRAATDRRETSARLQSYMASITQRLGDHYAAETMRQRATAVILDTPARPYMVREGRVVIDTSGIADGDVDLIRCLDEDALAHALKERRRRDLEHEDAAKLARDRADRLRDIEDCRRSDDRPDGLSLETRRKVEPPTRVA